MPNFAAKNMAIRNPEDQAQQVFVAGQALPDWAMEQIPEESRATLVVESESRPEDEQPYENKTQKELLAEARKRDLTLGSNLKADIIAALEADDENIFEDPEVEPDDDDADD